MFRTKGIINKSEIPIENYAAYSNTDFQELNIEPCQIGKNINIKFKDDLVKLFEKELERVDDYLCISSEHGNLPLFYNYEHFLEGQKFLEIGFYNYKELECDESDYIFNIELITENDLFDHDNKSNPIIPSIYKYKNFFFPNTRVNIDYKLEFIRYETDNGYFFQNLKEFKAIRASELSITKDKFHNTPGYFLSLINIGLSDINCTHYRRTYQKIQSLLADIMSIVNIFILIGKMISNILLQKKMNKDIVRSLINRNIYTQIKEHSLIEKNKKEKRLFKKKNEKPNNLERKNINKNIIEKTNIKDNSNKLFNINLNLSKNDLFFEKKIEENTNKAKMIKITKKHFKINYMYYLIR